VANAAAVEAYRLEKQFGDTRAVDDVSFSVTAGTVRGLLGRNGAGKTTLLRLLFGLMQPDSGEIRLFGQDAPTGDILAREGVAGFVEEPRFYPYLSARRNLELLGRLDGSNGSARADEALEAVGLADRRDQKVGNFSSGMRQRLGLAGSLLRRPRLLLLGEPTVGLDPGGSRDVRVLIRELAADGVTVLLSSHDMSEVDEICDSVVIVDRGRVVWDGTLDRLRDDAPAQAHRMATSDDDGALRVARELERVGVEREGTWLTVRAEDDARDDFVLALGFAGIAVRRLEPEKAPLEALFAALTTELGAP